MSALMSSSVAACDRLPSRGLSAVQLPVCAIFLLTAAVVKPLFKLLVLSWNIGLKYPSLGLKGAKRNWTSDTPDCAKKVSECWNGILLTKSQRAALENLS